MHPRIQNPALLLPDALQAMLAVNQATERYVPFVTRKLVHLRASQINGCAVCIEMHSRELKKSSERDERLHAVAAWRDAPYFSEAERAALALTEAVTRLSDREEPVPDAVWSEAARHYDEPALAALVVQIGLINMFNRVNVATRQIAGEWTEAATAHARAAS